VHEKAPQRGSPKKPLGASAHVPFTVPDQPRTPPSHASQAPEQVLLQQNPLTQVPSPASQTRQRLILQSPPLASSHVVPCVFCSMHAPFAEQ
jgi:hypothetical protein